MSNLPVDPKHLLWEVLWGIAGATALLLAAAIVASGFFLSCW